MKIAIVHDYLNQSGGAERAVGVLHGMFPAAPIYTSLVDRSVLPPELATADIRPSWMQKLPGWKKHFKQYLPFYPKAIESFDLRPYDLIISSSSAFAKGAIKGRNALHICYCYTPMRFAWNFHPYVAKEKLNALERGLLPFIIAGLRKWDIKTSVRPDFFIAISSVVQKRIRDTYGRDAEIIFPPVDVQKFQPAEEVADFYLIVSRLNSYKRIDLAVKAFNGLGWPLKIIGSGPVLRSLQALAGPNIEFLGRLADAEVARYYATCKALLLPGVEDFGITPLEANAAGRPVIAYGEGGAVDTVREGINGLLFHGSSADSLRSAVQVFETRRFEFIPAKIRAHALQFDKTVFKEKIKNFINGKINEKVRGV